MQPRASFGVAFVRPSSSLSASEQRDRVHLTIYYEVRCSCVTFASCQRFSMRTSRCSRCDGRLLEQAVDKTGLYQRLGGHAKLTDVYLSEDLWVGGSLQKLPHHAVGAYLLRGRAPDCDPRRVPNIGRINREE